MFPVVDLARLRFSEGIETFGCSHPRSCQEKSRLFWGLVIGGGGCGTASSRSVTSQHHYGHNLSLPGCDFCLFCPKKHRVRLVKLTVCKWTSSARGE